MTEHQQTASSRVAWVLLGAACAFVLTAFVPPMAVAAGAGMGAVALVRRRADAYGLFTIAYTVWCAVYVALAVFAVLTEGNSSGSDQWPPP